MVTKCRVIIGDGASIYPVALDRASPGEILLIEYDLTDDVDCAGDGVVISSVTWAINPGDDDGLLTLGTGATVGLVAGVLATLDADTTSRNYMITATISTSDGRRFPRSCSLPVVAVRAMNA